MINGYVPRELAIGELYLPPLLIAVAFAYLLSNLSMYVIAKFDWHRHLYMPSIVELALTTIYAVLLSLFVFPG